MTANPVAKQLKRPIRMLDLTGMYVITGLSLRWIATAAAVGPGALTLWLVAWASFFVPLATSVLVLSALYPGEGGLYIWAREAFGDFAGFVAGWCYLISNLPYFPAVLYFAAASLLLTRHGLSQVAKENGTYYILFSICCLLLITGLNTVGLVWSKWLSNLGAIGVWLPILALFTLGVITFIKAGSATHFTVAGLTPAPSFKDTVFLSTIAFAFAGCETASFMGDEIQNPSLNIPLALFLAGFVITLGYFGGTLAMLIALPAGQIEGLGGFMFAIDHMCRQFGYSALVPIIAILVALSNIGAASAYFTATARLPFVAGLDKHLPSPFARIHPRFGTPYIAIVSYGAASILIVLLSQAGTTVKGAYDVLVSLSVLIYFIPYLFLFAAVLRLERRRRWWLRALAAIGLITTLGTLVLSAIPAADDPDKSLTLWKTLGSTLLVVAAGAALYSFSARRKRLLLHGV